MKRLLKIESAFKNVQAVITSTVTTAFLLIFLSLPSYAVDVRYSYDSLNRLTRTDYSNGIRVQYTYDETGNRLVKETTQFPDTDEDGQYNNWDNCPNTYNPDQTDTFPPSGNNCGDACECKGDFNSDGMIPGAELGQFAVDFGREDCTGGTPCKGDFNCDGMVTGAELGQFAVDFGRQDCPICPTDPWCVY
jgi:YD repeat-containing protein